MILVLIALANAPLVALWLTVERIEYRARKRRRRFEG